MASGIAAQISKLYPEAVIADNNTKPGDHLKFGAFSNAIAANGKIIYNLYGQYKYGTTIRNVNYEALYTSLDLANKDMIQRNIKTAALPYNMGCGLAGGNWIIVNAIIEAVFKDSPIQLTICKHVA
jgi:hypothetical protein